MSQFSDEQLQRLLNAPLLVMENVMGVDGAGFFNAVRESKAALDFMREAMAHVPDNALVQQAGAYFLELVGKGSADDLPSTPTLAAFLDEMSALVALLGNDIDAHDYRAMLMGLAEQVAGAAGTGLLGRGEKISVEEGAVLHALAERLGFAL